MSFGCMQKGGRVLYTSEKEVKSQLELTRGNIALRVNINKK